MCCLLSELVHKLRSAVGVKSLFVSTFMMSIRGSPKSLKLGRQWETYSKAPNILLTPAGVVDIFILQKTSAFLRN